MSNAASAARPPHDVKRCAALGSRLGQRKRAAGEIEQRERDSSRRLLIVGEPAQAAGDHQVNDEEEIVFEREDDALADAANVEHAPFLHASRPAGRPCAARTD